MRACTWAWSPRDAASIAAAYLSGGSPIASASASTSSTQRRGSAERSGVHVERSEVVERVREQVQRARFARDAHASRCQHVPEVVVPEVLGKPARQPQPPRVRFTERVQHPRERLDRRRIPLGETRHERAEEAVCRAPGVSLARRARRIGHFVHVRALAKTPGVHGRGNGLEVGLASQRRIHGLEPSGRREQQRRRIAPTLAGEHDLGAQPVQSRTLELVDRPELGRGQQLRRGRGVGDVELGPGRGERALDARAGVGRQLGRPLQERRGRRQPSARLGPVGRSLQLAGHVLVRPVSGASAMPRPAIGVHPRVGRLRQRAMDLASLQHSRGAIRR